MRYKGCTPARPYSFRENKHSAAVVSMTWDKIPSLPQIQRSVNPEVSYIQGLLKILLQL